MDLNRDKAIKEEERRLRTFRFLSDITFQRLHVERMTLKEAYKAIDELRYASLALFPNKAHVFDLVIRPRMERVIAERFSPRN